MACACRSLLEKRRHEFMIGRSSKRFVDLILEASVSEMKKATLLWGVSFLVGFYCVFVIQQLWNWFTAPLLHFSEASAGHVIVPGSILLWVSHNQAAPDSLNGGGSETLGEAYGTVLALLWAKVSSGNFTRLN